MWMIDLGSATPDEARESIRRDLEQHPELTPLLDIDKDGSITCFGWTGPILDFKLEDMDAA